MIKTRTLALVLILTELASFAGYFFMALNIAGFFCIVIAALILSFKRLEYGLCFVLAELILGGKGYLFSANLGGTIISLRMALFVIVMAVWGARVVGVLTRIYVRPPSPGLRPPSPRGRGEGEGLLKWWGVLGIAILWGGVVGLARGNDFGNFFLDANGYFYAALILPFVWGITRKNTESDEKIAVAESVDRPILRPGDNQGLLRMLGLVFLVATTWLGIKTLLAVYFLTHAGGDFIGGNILPFYKWIRNTGVGEITWLPGNFARVFFQSHIYNVMAFLGLFTVVVTPPASPYPKGRKALLWALLALNAAVIIVSLSRSFWIGALVGLVVIAVALWYKSNRGFKRSIYFFAKYFQILLTSLLLTSLLLVVVARFPIPNPSAANFGAALNSRLQSGDAGSSRFNLLPPLVSAIKKHGIIGSGFGQTVTYISNDPRIRAENSTGQYTTYAFEWGWLDLWLKMGIVGIVAYVGLICALMINLYKHAKTQPLYFAVLAGLAGLTTIHFFTPYLNHPLGFGILILSTVLVNSESELL